MQDESGWSSYSICSMFFDCSPSGPSWILRVCSFLFPIRFHSGFNAILIIMFHVDADPAEQLVTMTFSGHVKAGEMRNGVKQITSLLTNMEPGFRVLTDLSKLKFMERSCVAYIGQIMDLFNAKGIGAVTRIVSDQKNGRAFTILAHFHYKPDVHIEVVESESEARQSLQNQFS